MATNRDALYAKDASGNVTGLVGPSGTVAQYFVTNKYSRAPTPQDNLSRGYTINSQWQYNGEVYQPIVAPTSTSAVWAPLLRSGHTVTDVIGSTNTKFAGGTVAMKGGFTGPALDVIVQTNAAGNYSAITTLNIIATGELDNVAVQALLAQAYPGSRCRVLRIYDQSGNNNHLIPGALAASGLITYASTGLAGTALTIVGGANTANGQLVFGQGVVAGSTVASGGGTTAIVLSAAGAATGAATYYFSTIEVPYLDWDAECSRFVISGTYDQSGVARQLRIPNTVAVGRQSLSMFALGRGVCTHLDGGVRVLAAAGDYLGGAGQIMAWQPTVVGSMSASNNPSGGTQAPATTIPWLNNLQISCLVQGAGTTLYSSNDLSASSVSTADASTLTGGWLFSDVGAGTRVSPMRLFGFALCGIAATAAQLVQIRQGFYAQYNASPQSMDKVFLIGDSRFAGAYASLDKSFGAQITQYLSTKPKIINMSAGGYTNASIAATTVPSAVAQVNSTAKNIAVMLIGVNDFIASALSVAQSLSAITANVRTLQTAGIKVVVIAELATANTTNSANTLLPQLQTLLKANACGADAIVDVSVYPEVLTPANAAYYPDGLHPSAALHNLIAGAVGDTVNKLLYTY